MKKRVRLEEHTSPAAASSQSLAIRKQPSENQPSAFKPPKALAQFFGNPPLIGSEKLEDYETLFAAVAAAAKPADAIAWLFVRDIVNLSWEIRREEVLKAQIIRIDQELAIARLLSPQAKDHHRHYATVAAQEEAREWARDPKARVRIEKKLAGWGYDETFVLAEAFKIQPSRIEAFDARIASYQARRMAALRMIEQYDAKLARRLDNASADIIDTEFTEAAE